MTIWKEFGGLGFRSLDAFNLSMLGKQGWILISNLDAMISKIFKTKYFPRGSFLDSELCHSASFTWRSIWSSRVLLKEGLRWKINGDGSHINVWNSVWLRNGDSLTFP